MAARETLLAQVERHEREIAELRQSQLDSNIALRWLTDTVRAQGDAILRLQQNK